MREAKHKTQERKQDIRNLNKAVTKIKDAITLLKNTYYPVEKDEYLDDSTECLKMLMNVMEGNCAYNLDKEGHEILGDVLECVSIVDSLDFVDSWKEHCESFFAGSDSKTESADTRANERIQDLLTRFKKEFEEIKAEREKGLNEAAKKS